MAPRRQSTAPILAKNGSYNQENYWQKAGIFLRKPDKDSVKTNRILLVCIVFIFHGRSVPRDIRILNILFLKVFGGEGGIRTLGLYLYFNMLAGHAGRKLPNIGSYS